MVVVKKTRSRKVRSIRPDKSIRTIRSISSKNKDKFLKLGIGAGLLGVTGALVYAMAKYDQNQRIKEWNRLKKLGFSDKEIELMKMEERERARERSHQLSLLRLGVQVLK